MGQSNNICGPANMIPSMFSGGTKGWQNTYPCLRMKDLPCHRCHHQLPRSTQSVASHPCVEQTLAMVRARDEFYCWAGSFTWGRRKAWIPPLLPFQPQIKLDLPGPNTEWGEQGIAIGELVADGLLQIVFVILQLESKDSKGNSLENYESCLGQ